MPRGRGGQPFLEWRRIREEAVAGVGSKHERTGGGKAPFAGYEPTRPSRLRGAPMSRRRCRSRLPTTARGSAHADEDGLRMLAALETLTSLEPDYSDDITAEASVTIIEVGRL